MKTTVILKNRRFILGIVGGLLGTALLVTSCGYPAADPSAYNNSGYSAGYEAGYAAAARINYNDACEMAAFLSDKMAYELELSASQYDAVYEINLDYLLSINGRDDLFSTYWNRRNSDLYYVLNPRQYNRFITLDYFYRPVDWSNHAYSYRFYHQYENRNHYYYHRPRPYETGYKGGYNKQKGSHYKGFENKVTISPRPTGTHNHSGSNQQNNQNPSFGNLGKDGKTPITRPASNGVTRPSTSTTTRPSTSPTTRPNGTVTRPTSNDGKRPSTSTTVRPNGNLSNSVSEGVTRPSSGTVTRPNGTVTRPTSNDGKRPSTSTTVRPNGNQLRGASEGVTRPSSGTVTRPNGTVTRPSSATTTRPSTSTTSRTNNNSSNSEENK